MKQRLLVLLMAFGIATIGILAYAQEGLGEGPSLDEQIDAAVGPVSNAITNFVFHSVPFGEEGAKVPVIVVWLIFTAAVFSIFFKFINFWGLRHAVDLVRGRYTDPSKPGEVTHFQALTAALSGTVGLGNIAGVAAAISLGGPGAMFWMVAAAVLGMATKFVECSLGAKYRVVHEDGTVSGGPMYYLSRGLAEHGAPRLGKFLAVFFAIMCICGAIGAGNMFQANQAYEQFVNATGGEASFFFDKGWLFGLILAVLVALVIIGGIKSIARVTEKVVPFMGGIYLLAGVCVIVVNYERIPVAFHEIFTQAFTPEAGYGGFIGVLMWGFQRATFSNEAGIGSAPIAYSAVRTAEPLSVGFVALLEPFIDTIIICTMTALVIVISGVYLDSTGLRGVEMTSAAFESVIDWFPYVLSLAVILFAFSTLITWSYYGLKSWTFLVGETAWADHFFKIIFCCFIVVGAAAELRNIIDIADAMIFAMAFPNAIGMFILARGLKRDLNSYWSRIETGS